MNGIKVFNFDIKRTRIYFYNSSNYFKFADCKEVNITNTIFWINLQFVFYSIKVHFYCCEILLLLNIHFHIINARTVFEISCAGATILTGQHSKQPIDLGTAVVMQLNSNWLPRPGDRGRTSPQVAIRTIMSTY